jgi:branched-subunit amino acid aminotransferase/4-amino-4-deoxychorismate lyase
MNSEKISVFTTLGWNGKRKFFAIDEHFKRLEHHANIAKIGFDENLKNRIKNQMMVQDFEFINYNYSNELCKPPGLITIRLGNNGDFLISERSNEYNINCKFINAITVNAPENIKENHGVKLGEHLPYRNAFKIAKENDGNAALLVNGDAVIDGDRATLMILDKDGIAWVSSEKYGSIKSVTVKLIKDELFKKGIPISFGKITTDLILRSSDAIMLGTGLGVTRINSIDNRKFQFASSILFDNVKSVLSKLMDEKWTDLNTVDAV